MIRLTRLAPAAVGLASLLLVACGSDDVGEGNNGANSDVQIVNEKENAETMNNMANGEMNKADNSTMNNTSNSTQNGDANANMGDNSMMNNSSNQDPNATANSETMNNMANGMANAEPNNTQANNTQQSGGGSTMTIVDDEVVMIAMGQSSDITFDVPDDAVSVTVTVTGQAGETYAVGKWLNGDGTPLIYDAWYTSEMTGGICLMCDNRIVASESAFASLAPNNEVPTIVPGTHTVTAAAFTQSLFALDPAASAMATVRVEIKVAPEEPAMGTLDLNLYFSGAGDLTAESAQADADFQQTLTDLNALYQTAGITIGEVTYTDIDPMFQVIEGVLEPDSDLQRMFALSGDNSKSALNVFVVQEINAGGPLGNFGTILGISGGIPGPPMNGTGRSGVALALERTPEANTDLYKVFGHEVGHHLGLFHTSEQNFGFGPQVHDPIGDTAENDDTNLMFHFGDGETLSATQARVMRLNAWVGHGGE